VCRPICAPAVTVARRASAPRQTRPHTLCRRGAAWLNAAQSVDTMEALTRGALGVSVAAAPRGSPLLGAAAGWHLRMSWRASARDMDSARIRYAATMAEDRLTPPAQCTCPSSTRPPVSRRDGEKEAEAPAGDSHQHCVVGVAFQRRLDELGRYLKELRNVANNLRRGTAVSNLAHQRAAYGQRRRSHCPRCSTDGR
jgi:hypothetical protein